jgi:hypothetical protein
VTTTPNNSKSETARAIFLPVRITLLARLFGRFRSKSCLRDRQAILSNIDWVIEMLRRVRDDEPEASARWWDGVKQAALEDRDANPSKPPSLKES